MCRLFCCCVWRNRKKRNRKDEPKSVLKYIKHFVLRKYSQFSQITDYLYLTGIGGMTKENLTNNDIKCVINVTTEFQSFPMEGITTFRIPIEDQVTVDIFQYFDMASDKINDLTKNKTKTVVHCIAGVSRSTTIVIAYLMKYNKMTIEDAFKFVLNRRPVVMPNDHFFQQLLEYEKQLFGEYKTEFTETTKNKVKRICPKFVVKDPNLNQMQESNLTDSDIISTANQTAILSVLTTS